MVDLLKGNRMVRTLVVLFVGLSVAGCGSAPQLPPPFDDPAGGGLPSLQSEALTLDDAAAQALLDEYAKRYTQGYPLHAGDKLQFQVAGHPDLTFAALVPVEGAINFPSIGKLDLVGRTVTDVRAELARRLADGYLVNPDVTVIVQEYARRSVYVLGAVMKPAEIELPGGRPITLMQAISQANGFKDDAEKRGVLIYRAKQPGGTERIAIQVDLVALTRTAKGKDPLLVPGDQIYVPARDKVYVFGQVIRAGGYVIPADQPTTISQIVSMAGGFTRIAQESSVRLNRRLKNGQRASYVIDVGRVLAGHPEEDVPLQPGDVVFVPESFF